MELLATATNIALTTYHEKFKIQLIIYNILILFFAISLLVTILLSLNYYKFKIEDYADRFFVDDKQENILENKLKNLKIIINNFNTNNLKNYEINDENIMNDYVMEIELYKKKLKEEKDLQNKNPRNSVININTNIIPYSTKQNVNINTKSGEQESTRNENKEYKISLIKNSIYIVILAFLFYLSVCLTNIFLSNKNFNDFKIVNAMSINFLERLPKVAEILLYYKISVIANDINFLKTRQSDYNLSLPSNYYNKIFDLSKDSIYTTLKDSEFANMYYKISVLRYNIKMFMNTNHDSNMMPYTKKYELSLYTKDFCANFLIRYMSLNSFGTIKAGFINFNGFLVECKTAGNGLNLSGIVLALDNIINNIQTAYIDFASQDKTKRNQIASLTDLRLLRALIESEFPIKKLQTTYLGTILDDVNNYYSYLKQTEYYFSVIGIVFSLCFTIYVNFWMINKLSKYVFQIEIAVKKYKKAILFNIKTVQEESNKI